MSTSNSNTNRGKTTPASSSGSFKSPGKSDPEGSLPAPAEAPASKRLPTGPYRPGTLGGYEVKNYKPVKMGPEGGAFTASIYRDGKRVMSASNDGWGGANLYGSVKQGVGIQDELAGLIATSQEARQDDWTEPDVFLDTVRMAGDFQRHAQKNGFTYDQVAAASVGKMSFLDDRERDLLLNPRQLSDPE